MAKIARTIWLQSIVLKELWCDLVKDEKSTSDEGSWKHTKYALNQGDKATPPKWKLVHRNAPSRDCFSRLFIPVQRWGKCQARYKRRVTVSLGVSKGDQLGANHFCQWKQKAGCRNLFSEKLISKQELLNTGWNSNPSGLNTGSNERNRHWGSWKEFLLLCWLSLEGKTEMGSQYVRTTLS